MNVTIEQLEAKHSELAALQAVAGGSALLSNETAVEEAAQVLGIDPQQELLRMHEEKVKTAVEQAATFGAPGELGEDADDEDPKPGKPGKGKPANDGKDEDEEDEGE